MLFGGGELLMELVEVIKDEPAFDAAWVDFCKYYNATNAEYADIQMVTSGTHEVLYRKVERYGKSWNSGGFNDLYSKLQAYAGKNEPFLGRGNHSLHT